jgi:hypothetical protein
MQVIKFLGQVLTKEIIVIETLSVVSESHEVRRPRPSLFWDVTRSRLVAGYRRFGIISLFHFQRSDIRVRFLFWTA